MIQRRGGVAGRVKSPLIGGILAKPGGEASIRTSGAKTAAILLFKGIFCLTVRAWAGNVSGFLLARKPA